MSPVEIPRSLDEVHSSVNVPQNGAWLRRLFAFVGPAYMVAVGYMDPGNWATDIAGGSKFGYRLLWVLLMSNLMAILLQTLSARLGLVTGRDLAQACRENYGPKTRWVLFILCEIAIAACDLAEVLGTAIGINLLFPQIPLFWAVAITGGDAMLLLLIQKWGVRKMEAFILWLISIIGICFIVQMFLARPDAAGIAAGFVPKPFEGGELYIAIGILGATVMPHNLYLHSALVQSRRVPRTLDGIGQATRFNLVDSAIALNAALFVNAAILIVAAAAFGSRGLEVTGIQDAHRLLQSVLGTQAAPIAFALALIAAGQSSTLTGTLAGQITMEGFLQIRIRPWLRRMITRSMALIPAMLVIGLAGEEQTENLLILSQVILSLQLSFAVVPLVKLTSSRRWMRDFVNPLWVQTLAWAVAGIIMILNVKLVFGQIAQWTQAAGAYGPLVTAGVLPIAAGLTLLLLWMAFKPEHEPPEFSLVRAHEVAAAAIAHPQAFHRIGVALEAKPTDAAALAEAAAIARAHKAEIILIHVVEGVGGQWYGREAGDTEQRHDEEYLTALAQKLRDSLGSEVSGVRAILGFGSDIPGQLVKIVKQENLDLVVTGGHGHRKFTDIFTGETIASLRHRINVPVLSVRGKTA